MRRFILFFGACLAATALAGSPPLKEQSLAGIKATISLPDGWVVKDQSEEDAPVYQIVREKPAPTGDETAPGFLLSVTTKVPERTKSEEQPGMTASAYAAELLPSPEEPGGKEMKKTTEEPFQVFSTSFVNPEEQSKVVVVAKANDKTGTLYYLEWRSSMMEEADLAEVREVILNSLKLDPSF